VRGSYYNEVEPFKAAWLRELMKANVIAPGEVDERSIVDVRPDDLHGFSQWHLFAGVGIWSYSLRGAGWPDDRLVMTASCPCQPFSAAGKGMGFEDERHLWPAAFELIKAIRPPVLLGEQVSSKDGLVWFGHVKRDLNSIDYAVMGCDIPASAFGAPHIRQRLYFLGEAQ